MRKEETNGIGKERTVETLDMTLREMAMCPGARKDKRIDGREMLETHMKRKIRKRWKKGYGNGSGRRRI